MAPSCTIGFNDLLDVLSEVFHVPADGRKALTSRLKHLQGKSFPPGVNVGRGGRVRYDVEAVLGIVLVMTLTAAFIPPNQAVEVVRGHWSDWRDMLEAAARSRHPDMGGEVRSDRFAVIESNALADLGGATPSEGRSAGIRGTLSFRVVDRAALGADPAQAPRAATLVDVATVLDEAVHPLARAASCQVEEVLAALIAAETATDPA